MKFLTTALGATVLFNALPVVTTNAFAGPVGQLVCNVSGGVGFVITSSRGLNCEYSRANGAPLQHYLGTINNFGLTLGNQGPGKLTWGVVSVGGTVGSGALAGTFQGASASASAGQGIGTNALFDGNNGGILFNPYPFKPSRV